MSSHAELIHELKTKLKGARRHHKPSNFQKCIQYIFIAILIAIDIWLLRYIYDSLRHSFLEETCPEPMLEDLDSLYKVLEKESNFTINSFQLENLNNLLLFVESEGLLHNEVTGLLSKNNVTMNGAVNIYSNAVGPAKFAKLNRLIRLYFALRKNLHQSLIISEQAIRKQYEKNSFN